MVKPRWVDFFLFAFIRNFYLLVRRTNIIQALSHQSLLQTIVHLFAHNNCCHRMSGTSTELDNKKQLKVLRSVLFVLAHRVGQTSTTRKYTGRIRTRRHQLRYDHGRILPGYRSNGGFPGIIRMTAHSTSILLVRQGCFAVLR